MIRSMLRAAAAAPLVALALAGCSQDNRPVARVGQHTLTVGDFVRAARRSGDALQLPADSARARVLDTMVRDELIFLAAQAHGLDTTRFTKQKSRTEAEKALLGALSTQLAPLDPGVTDAEVRTLHAWRQTQSDVQLAYAPDSSTIELARARITAGEPFSRVADEFGGARVLPPGGALGFRVPGSLPQPLDDAMRTLPVGALGGPYRTSVGWFLVRVSGRAPAPPRPFEQERAGLENLVRQRKRQAALAAGVERLVPSYHLAIAADAGQFLFRLLEATRVSGTASEPPSPSEQAHVLARFDGGTYTVADAWEDLANPGLNKPNTSMVPALREWVRDRSVMRIALAEARRRHLDEEPGIAGPLADQVRDYVMGGEYQNVVASVPPPDETTLRATWEPMKDRFPMMQGARVLWTTIADTAKAIAVGQRAGQGSLRDVARAVDPAIVVREETLRYPNADPQWAALQGELQRLQPGQWASPGVTPGGFRMLQLVDKTQGPVSWEQLPMEVRQSLANNLVQASRNQRLATYVDSLRRTVNIVLLPDALRRVPWPVPPGGTP